ncbi:hypothetical protein HME9304_01842 [Flagellimonas maritima]|uniref:Uncharacterized protein n=1 Tax=Flagellimonas maritima TaxID=1383885 RepID=A0A2Z4LU67_9FLAO|nr:hypothetical protein HME9304_01842 [Allomuricauda aurantiaca]
MWFVATAKIEFASKINTLPTFVALPGLKFEFKNIKLILTRNIIR